LQIVESKEAGACGVLGIVCQVSGKGTPVMSSFASAMGLDAPPEVVNSTELDFVLSKGVPMIAINCAVGLSVSIPGFAPSVADGILRSLPLNCPGIVGVASLDGARRASQSGASAVLLKSSMLEGVCENASACSRLIGEIRDALGFDD
jgi:hypothetical protein